MNASSKFSLTKQLSVYLQTVIKKELLTDEKSEVTAKKRSDGEEGRAPWATLPHHVPSPNSAVQLQGHFCLLNIITLSSSQ